MAFTVLAVIVLCYSGYGVVFGIAKFPTPTLCTPPPPRKRAGKGRDAQGSERLFIDASTIEGVTVALWLRQWTDVRPTAPALRAPDPHRARERERLEEEDWCCCGHASQGCKQKFFFVVPPLSSHCKWMG